MAFLSCPRNQVNEWKAILVGVQRTHKGYTFVRSNNHVHTSKKRSLFDPIPKNGVTLPRNTYVYEIPDILFHNQLPTQTHC